MVARESSLVVNIQSSRSCCGTLHAPPPLIYPIPIANWPCWKETAAFRQSLAEGSLFSASKTGTQQAGKLASMKTTLDLPDELVREMKLRAVMQGRTLRDLAADFMRQGLGLAAFRPVQELPTHSPVQIGLNGLPVIRCSVDASAHLMALDELLALEQKTLIQEDLQRAGLPF